MGVVFESGVIGIDHRNSEHAPQYLSNPAQPERVMDMDDVRCKLFDFSPHARGENIGNLEFTFSRQWQ